MPTSFRPCDGSLSALRRRFFQHATAALSARDGSPFGA
ncbi:hypothetical protein HMPREF9135_1041 [Segatella baroniae F0067]|uniref:Uncharacterized protein n=1 Tax=Segatella baroniae F0067 TaxID=1115809 RepID=U2P3E5_9BACT|nr:hypothetical protein HMPREF9135_1041 [Segatella baroniae F0067]